MMLLYLRNGDCVEVEGATAADRRNDRFVCFDAEGREVVSYPWGEIEAYTLNEQMAKILLDEACEDLTVIPADRQGSEEPEGTAP